MLIKALNNVSFSAIVPTRITALTSGAIKKDTSVGVISSTFPIEKECLDENKILVIALDDEEANYIHPNLTGLVAMKLCQMYNRPAIVTRIANDDVYKNDNKYTYPVKCNDGDIEWDGIRFTMEECRVC